MSTGCKIYSTEHAETLHRDHTALARLNLLHITISEKLSRYMMTNAIGLHTKQLMCTIYDHRWLRTMSAMEAPIDAKS
jgi:hypothetical protein